MLTELRRLELFNQMNESIKFVAKSDESEFVNLLRKIDGIREQPASYYSEIVILVNDFIRRIKEPDKSAINQLINRVAVYILPEVIKFQVDRIVNELANVPENKVKQIQIRQLFPSGNFEFFIQSDEYVNSLIVTDQYIHHIVEYNKYKAKDSEMYFYTPQRFDISVIVKQWLGN